MALAKSVTLGQTGATATYWRIASAEAIHSDTPCVQVQVTGYVSLAVREAQGTPVTERRFRLVLGDFPMQADLHGITTSDIYTALKAKVNATTAPAPTSLPASTSDGTSRARASIQPDPLAGAVDA